MHSYIVLIQNFHSFLYVAIIHVQCFYDLWIYYYQIYTDFITLLTKHIITLLTTMSNQKIYNNIISDLSK